MQCSAVLCCFARLSARKPPAVIFANLRRRGRHVAAIKAGHRHKRPPAAHGLHRRRDGNAHLARPPHTPAPAGPPGQAIETKDGRDSGTPSETRVMVLHSVHGSSSCDMNTVLGGNGWEAQWEHEDAYARRTRTAVWAGGRARHESLQRCLLPLSGARLRLVRFLRLSAPPWGPSEPTPGRWNRTSARSMGTRKS